MQTTIVSELNLCSSVEAVRGRRGLLQVIGRLGVTLEVRLDSKDKGKGVFAAKVRKGNILRPAKKIAC